MLPLCGRHPPSSFGGHLSSLSCLLFPWMSQEEASRMLHQNRAQGSIWKLPQAGRVFFLPQYSGERTGTSQWADSILTQVSTDTQGSFIHHGCPEVAMSRIMLQWCLAGCRRHSPSPALAGCVSSIHDCDFENTEARSDWGYVGRGTCGYRDLKDSCQPWRGAVCMNKGPGEYRVRKGSGQSG